MGNSAMAGGHDREKKARRRNDDAKGREIRGRHEPVVQGGCGRGGAACGGVWGYVDILILLLPIEVEPHWVHEVRSPRCSRRSVCHALVSFRHVPSCFVFYVLYQWRSHQRAGQTIKASSGWTQLCNVRLDRQTSMHEWQLRCGVHK